MIPEADRRTPQSAELKPTLNIGKKVVNFIGPEGSGKTDISKMLAKESGMPRLSVGDILRDFAVNDQGPLGAECRDMFAQHRYFSDRKMLLDIYAERFKREDLADGFILDGSLRDVTETEGFQGALERAGRVMPVVVVRLRVPGWMSVQRLSTDPDARGRIDDDADSVLSRLSNYYNRLGERVSIMHKQPDWQFISIDSRGTIEETFPQVRAAFSE